jgi:hypothetical protein
MLSNYKLKHTTAGLLDKFIGRNNDYEGYWALGVLYAESRAWSLRVELDLLGAVAQPDTPASASLARAWAHHLRQALRRHKLSPDELAHAGFVIEFGLPPVPKRPGHIEYGDPFLCRLRLEATDGRMAERRRMAHCRPADEFRGSRSTRYTG